MPDWLKETLTIVLALGGLETLLWYLDRRGQVEDRVELKQQTELLEDIAVSLGIKEIGETKDEETVGTNS